MELMLSGAMTEDDIREEIGEELAEELFESAGVQVSNG